MDKDKTVSAEDWGRLAVSLPGWWWRPGMRCVVPPRHDGATGYQSRVTDGGDVPGHSREPVGANLLVVAVEVAEAPQVDGLQVVRLGDDSGRVGSDLLVHPVLVVARVRPHHGVIRHEPVA